MAKKRQKKQGGQQFLSDEDYIRQRARTLKIGTCYVSDAITKAGESNIIISRLHTGGRVSIGVYLVDAYCLGLKDSFYRLRIEDYELEDIVSQNFRGFSDHVLGRILALPQDTLREDLEQLLYYHIGLTCDGIPEDYDADGYDGTLTHCVILLAEVGNDTSSLEAVLEVLRQNNEFGRQYLGGISCIQMSRPESDRIVAKTRSPLQNWTCRPQGMRRLWQGSP